ncbi:hypothetical protein ACKVMT_07090 [Halobacteriales archaeon Cl-PHB]
MRIRTDGDYAYREDTIENTTEFYGRNKTESLLRAAEDVPELVEAIRRTLERDDFTHAQRRELANQLSTRHFEFAFSIEDGEIDATVLSE